MAALDNWDLSEVQRVSDPLVQESTSLEKKRSEKFTSEEVSRQLCAFANGDGGHIVFGVKDSKDGGGLDSGLPNTVRRQPVTDWVRRIAIDKCRPAVHCEVKHIPYSAGGPGAIVIYVPTSESRSHWVTDNNIAYLRIGTFSNPMPLQTFADMHNRIAPSVAQIEDIADWIFPNSINAAPLEFIPTIRLVRGSVVHSWIFECQIKIQNARLFSPADEKAFPIGDNHIGVRSQEPLYPGRRTRAAASWFGIQFGQVWQAVADGTIEFALYTEGSEAPKKTMTVKELCSRPAIS
jgi:hypothetical protein